MKEIRLLIFYGLVFLGTLVQGQELTPIHADRPDQSDGTYILKPTSFQLETGIVFSQTGKQLSDIFQSTLLRYGVIKNWEFRILIDEGLNSGDDFKTAHFGLSPVSLSSKVALTEQHNIWPAITAVGYLQLPFAATKMNKTDRLAPTVLLAFENEVTADFSVGYNIGISWDGIEKAPAYVTTVSLGQSISDRWSVFAEYFSNFSKQNKPAHNIDFGTQYQVSSQIQLDFAIGRSLFDHGQSNFGTVGLTYAFR